MTVDNNVAKYRVARMAPSQLMAPKMPPRRSRRRHCESEWPPGPHTKVGRQRGHGLKLDAACAAIR